MANAWLLPPLPIKGVVSGTTGTALGALMNVGNDYAGVVFRSGIALYANGPLQLDVDLGADMPIDTVMLFGLAGMNPAARAIITVCTNAAGYFEGATFSSAAQPIFAGSAMPVNGLGAAVLNAPAGSYRRVRLTLSNVLTSDYLELSRFVVGKRIQLERNFGFGATFGVRDLGALDFSRRGVLQRARGKKLRTVGLTFANVRKDEVEQQTRPLLEQIGNTEMVALVTDPAEHIQRQNRCYYGPLVGDLGQTWRKADLFEAKANMVSIF